MARSKSSTGNVKTTRKHGKMTSGRLIMSNRQQAKVIAKRKKEKKKK